MRMKNENEIVTDAAAASVGAAASAAAPGFTIVFTVVSRDAAAEAAAPAEAAAGSVPISFSFFILIYHVSFLISFFISILIFSFIFGTSASERIWTGPDRSQQVRKLQKTYANSRKLTKICENFAKKILKSFVKPLIFAIDGTTCTLGRNRFGPCLGPAFGKRHCCTS